MTDHCDLLILAPAGETKTTDGKPWRRAPFNYEYEGNERFYGVIEEFVDEGVAFPFDEDQRLPRQLPDCLDPFKCVVIDPARRDEFSTGTNAEKLAEFQRAGGYVCFPRLDNFHLRMNILRTIVTAGLQRRNPVMLQRLNEYPIAKQEDWWLSIIPEKAREYNRYAWGDPVAYHFYWPVTEAAAFYDRPEMTEPVWETMYAALKNHPDGSINCGKRFALKLYERTGERWILERVIAKTDATLSSAWRYRGVLLNQDLQAPEGCSTSDLPPRVRNNIWLWPETAGNLGDSLGYLTKVSGNPAYAELAIKQVLTSHQWCFNRESCIWHHVGRPSGPDPDSAPWGRGCGWMLYGLRGLLEDLPDNHPARPELIRALDEALDGFLRFQDEYGLWHNVVDDPSANSRQDSCITWMALITYARAYWKGWLRDPRVPPMLAKARAGLRSKIWRGLPVAHCHGTSYMTSRQGYLARPHMRFLFAPLLLAEIEFNRMLAVQA